MEWFKKSPTSYNADNELAFLFVKNYATILARALSVKGDLSDKHIKEVSSKVKIPPFVPKTVKIKVKDDEPDDQQKLPANEQELEEAELTSLMKELSLYDKKKADSEKCIQKILKKMMTLMDILILSMLVLI